MLVVAIAIILYVKLHTRTLLTCVYVVRAICGCVCMIVCVCCYYARTCRLSKIPAAASLSAAEAGNPDARPSRPPNERAVIDWYVRLVPARVVWYALYAFGERERGGVLPLQ